MFIVQVKYAQLDTDNRRQNRVGQNVTFNCNVNEDVQRPVNVTWRIDGEVVQQNGSTYKMQLSANDDNRVIRCEAVNIKGRHPVKSKEYKIQVIRKIPFTQNYHCSHTL